MALYSVQHLATFGVCRGRGVAGCHLPYVSALQALLFMPWATSHHISWPADLAGTEWEGRAVQSYRG